MFDKQVVKVLINVTDYENGFLSSGEDHVKSRYLLNKKQLKANDYHPNCYKNGQAESDDGKIIR